MFDYNICSQADYIIFEKQCFALEKNIPNIEKSNLLTDVDGSKIQFYKINGSTIKVYIDYDIDAVYVESEIELTQYLK